MTLLTFLLSAVVAVNIPIEHQWIWQGDDDRTLDIFLSSDADTTVTVECCAVRDLTLMLPHKDTVLHCVRTVSLKAGAVNVPVAVDISSLTPGFYRISVTGVEDFNIGMEPDKVVSPQDKEPDFDEFWSATLAELAGIPMDVKMTLQPEHSNGIRRCYHVEVNSLGGEVMGGIYYEPVAEGEYPAYIEYMGYGADPYYRDPSSDPDKVQFLVSVRDQGIFKDKEERWIDRGLESRENFYYRGAFCDVVRAVDFIASRSKVDKSRMFAFGDSQGGAFTWICGSLDHRVKAIAPSVPFLCDYQHYSQIVYWPMWEVFETADKQGIDRRELMRMLSYFDVKNFTDRVQCPVEMAFGLQDPTCPPHTNFAGYSQVKGAKKWFCVPTCGHAMWMEQSWEIERNAFLR